MNQLILRRLGTSLLVVIAVSIVVFSAMLFLPGDPARTMLGDQATAEHLAALHAHLGLDASPVQRYLSWIGGIAVGDFGTSVATGGPVTELLGINVINSLVLLAGVAIVALPLGLLIGSARAQRRHAAAEASTTWVSLVVAALPEFLIGVLLVGLLASAGLRVLPAVALSPPGTPVWDEPLQFFLPWLTLVLVATASMVRMTQTAMLPALASGAVEMARLKGVPERDVIRRHALPQATGPLAHAVAVHIAWLIGGVIVVEYLYEYPGIGHALVDAVTHRDIQAVQAIALLITIAFILVHLVAELIGLAANPRARSAS